MGNVLAVFDVKDDPSCRLGCLQAAREMASFHGAFVVALVVGEGAAEVSASLERFTHTALWLDDRAVEPYLPEDVAPHVLRNLEAYDASAIVAPATGYGAGLLGRLAGMLDVGIATEITSVVSGNTFWRPVYQGSVFAQIEVSSEPVLATVQPSAFEAAPPLQRACGRVPAEVGTFRPHGIEVLARSRPAPGQPQLRDADIVVAGGRGMGGVAGFDCLAQLCDRLGAAMGASMAATTAGYVSYHRQIGQTGAVVAPSVYFAIGISGALEHLVGMRDSKLIVAVNSDRNAPIFEVADLGIVAPWEEVLPQLLRCCSNRLTTLESELDQPGVAEVRPG